MTPSDLRIVMAELDGFTDIEIIGGDPCGFKATEPHTKPFKKVIPNYLEDLNAVHELEKKLTASETYTYYNTVRMIIARDYPKQHKGMPMTGLPEHDTTFVSAEALQRCEALARLHGKWKD